MKAPLSPASIDPARSRRRGLLLSCGLLGGFFLGFIAQEIRVSITMKNPTPSADDTPATPAIRPATATGSETRQARLFRDLLTLGQRTTSRVDRRRFLAALQQLQPGDFPAALAAVLRGGASLSGVAEPMWERWGALDPTAAAAYLQAHGATWGSGSISYARGLARGWSAHDPTAAQTWAAALHNPKWREAAINELMSVLATKDPEGALRWLHALPKMHPQPDETQFYLRWSERDPAAAARMLNTYSRYDPAYGNFTATLHSWVRRDPEAALAWVSQLPKADYTQDKLQRAWNEWSSHDPEAAFAAAQRQPDEAIRQTARHHALVARVVADPASAEKIIAELPPGTAQRDAWFHAAESVRYSDPAQSAEWMLRADPKRLTSRLRMQLKTWSAEDPAAAMAFVDRHFPPSDRSYGELFAEASSFAGQRDPIGTLEQFLQRPELPFPAAWRTVRAWAEQDPRAALAWADSHLLTLPQDQTKPFVETLEHLSKFQPQLAAERYRQLPPSQQTPLSTENLATTLARRDLMQAQAWAETLPPESQRHAYRVLGNEKARDGGATITDWLNQLPAGPARDGAAQGVMQSMSRFDPAGAAQYLEKIIDPKERAAALGQLQQAWEPHDPEGFAAWRKGVTP